MVWITGAAGGLGQALVGEFAAQGWRVAAAGHRVAFPRETEQIWPVQLEVTDRAQAQHVAQQIVERWGQIDVLINNAGITNDQLVNRMTESDWDQVLQVNLKGAFLCAQAVLPIMIRQRRGHIVQVASFAAKQGGVGQANYAAAKAGLLGLTTALAREAGPDQVRVNAILPGVLATRMTAKLSAAQLAALASSNLLGRLNSTAEVARFTAFLSTLDNVSGQVFQLDSRIARWT